MTSKYDGSRGAATHLLRHYFRLVAERAGVQWDSDNDAEVGAIVDGIITAAVHQVAEDSARAAQARRELEALDLEDFAQQPVDATQEDGADMAPAYECYQCGASLVYDERGGSISCPVHGSDFLPPAMRRALDGDLQCGMCQSHITSTYAVAYEDGYLCPACASEALRSASIGMHRLRETIASLRAQQAGTQAQRVAWVHVPPVADSLSECPSCLTEIGVLFWQDGKSLVQECPTCGVFLDVYKNDDGLHVHAVGLERPSESESGGTLEDVRGELPVPVSAIAYLMADIAPADEYDTAKQQEARATVIAWLESLEAEED